MNLVETLHTAAIKRQTLAAIRLETVGGEGPGALSEKAVRFVCRTAAGIVEGLVYTRPATQISAEVYDDLASRINKQAGKDQAE